jgi:hypothetical protein
LRLKFWVQLLIFQKQAICNWPSHPPWLCDPNNIRWKYKIWSPLLDHVIVSIILLTKNLSSFGAPSECSNMLTIYGEGITLSAQHQSQTNTSNLVVRQVLTAASMKMAVFVVVAPYSLAEVYRRFRGASRVQHPGRKTPNYKHAAVRTSDLTC